MQSRFIGWALGGTLMLGLCAGALAQQMYKHVDANGRITFSDKPPSPGASGKFEPVTGRAQGSSNAAALPLEVRQAADRYPVTLFTGPNCEPCDAGRNILTRRGVPFSERTVVTAADGEALRRLTGDQSLPMLAVGGQQIKGFSDFEWNQFLDAAGYPGTSQLPSGYSNPAPPAAPPAAQAVAPPPRPRPAAVQAPTQPVPDSENPSGIKF